MNPIKSIQFVGMQQHFDCKHIPYKRSHKQKGEILVYTRWTYIY
jgi:hypothetical protein